MVNKSKRLLVEGVDDLHCVVHMMEHHVEWLDGRENAPVDITAVGSVSKILDKTYLKTKLKESGLTILGIIVDADEHSHGRWQSLAAVLQELSLDAPADMPPQGYIAEITDGPRIGIWIMPDNSSQGMIETFLQKLIPLTSQEVWSYSLDAVDTAVSLGAPCKSIHSDKARLHTWLAWQDPPGERMSIAIAKKILDPLSPAGTAFVRWFMELYDIPALVG